MNNKTITNITISGVMTALAILFGTFVHFPFGGGNVSLIILVIGLLPAIVRFPYALLVSGISVVLTDVINGWAGFAWISLIAYSIFMLIHYYGTRVTFITSFTLLIASIALILIYFVFEMLVFDWSLAINDLIATTIQMAISYPILLILIPLIKKTKLIV